MLGIIAGGAGQPSGQRFPNQGAALHAAKLESRCMGQAVHSYDTQDGGYKVDVYRSNQYDFTGVDCEFVGIQHHDPDHPDPIGGLGKHYHARVVIKRPDYIGNVNTDDMRFWNDDGWYEIMRGDNVPGVKDHYWY